VNKKLKT